VPYSDYFNLEENWLITSTDGQAEKCIVRLSAYVIFKKSTLFKGKIENNNISSATANFQHWVKWADTKISRYLKQKAIKVKIPPPIV
jgi:hypothetical protein